MDVLILALSPHANAFRSVGRMCSNHYYIYGILILKEVISMIECVHFGSVPFMCNCLNDSLMQYGFYLVRICESMNYFLLLVLPGHEVVDVLEQHLVQLGLWIVQRIHLTLLHATNQMIHITVFGFVGTDSLDHVQDSPVLP